MSELKQKRLSGDLKSTPIKQVAESGPGKSAPRGISELNMRNSRMSKHADFDSSIMDGSVDYADSVRSPLYAQIGSIPSGRYGTVQQQQTIQQLLQSVAGGQEGLAAISPDQAVQKMKGQFQGIFNQRQGLTESLLKDITTHTQTQGKTKFPQIQSPQASGARQLHNSARKLSNLPQLDQKIRLKKKSGFASAGKHGSVDAAFSTDPAMQIYLNAQQQIIENIAEAKLANRQIIQRKMAGGAREQSKGLTTKNLAFTTVQEALYEGLTATRQVNYQEASSLAGAKTKYTASFRLNQNPNNNTIQHSPTGASLQFLQSKLTHQGSTSKLHQGSNTQSGQFGQTAPSTNQQSDSNLHSNIPGTQSGVFLDVSPAMSGQASSQAARPEVQHSKQGPHYTTIKRSNEGERYATRAAMNLVEANANSTQDYKAKALDDQQSNIQQLHTKHMANLDVSKSGLLHQMEKMLPHKYKKIFLEQQNSQQLGHLNLFEDLNELNHSFVDVLDSTCTYRIELGVMLQQMVESYCSIFLQQYEVFYHQKFDKEIELQTQITENQKIQIDLEKIRGELQQRQEFCEHYIKSKDQEVASHQTQIDDLEKQLAVVREMKKMDDLEEEEQKEIDKVKKEEFASKPKNVENYDKQKRMALRQNPNSTALLMDPTTLPEMVETIDEFAEASEDRNKYVEQLYAAVKQMMATASKSVKIQTDEACMNNAKMYEYFSYGSSSEDKGAETDGQKDPIQEKINQIKKERGIDTTAIYSDSEDADAIAEEMQEDGNQEGEATNLENGGEKSKQPDSKKSKQLKIAKTFTLGKNPSGPSSSKASRSSRRNRSQLSTNPKSKAPSKLSKQGHSPQLKQGNTASERVNDNFDLLDVPVTHHNDTMRQIGLQNANKMFHLHNSFDKIALRIKKKKMLEPDFDPTKVTNSRNDLWRIPYRIIAFCENRIQQMERDPAMVEQFQIQEWKKFKEKIFDIYDHRIKHAPELNGAVNTNYCALNEHIIIYFVDQCKTRAKAEEKLVSCLINLKYYYDFWQRARIFAWNMQLTYVPQDPNRLKKDENAPKEGDRDEFDDLKVFEQPHAYLKDFETSDHDIFAQEFFLQAYSLLSIDRAQFLESKEGMTYFRTKHHEKIAAKIIPLIKGNGGDLQKWHLQIKRIIKRIKKGETEQEYLDLDLVIAMMLQAFKDQRRNFQKELQKNFLRLLDAQAAPCELEQYTEIIKQTIPEPENGLDNALMKYPGRMSQIRGYIFAAISSETNTNVVQDIHFLAGCSRFALENPVPTVATRCALYGNTRDILTLLAEAEKQFGKPQKVDSKFYTSWNLGQQPQYKPEPAGDQGDNSDKDYEQKPTIDVHETPRESVLVDDEQKLLALIQNRKHNNSLLGQTFFKPSTEAKAALSSKATQLMVGGTRYKIKAIQKKTSKKDQETDLGLRLPEDDFDGFVYDVEENNNTAKTMQNLNDGIIEKDTEVQKGVTGQQIIVPSFQTTAKIFGQHFLILQELKYKIDTLKQAYLGQMDSEKTWEQVNEILRVLKIGCKFLDFPADAKLRQHLLSDIVAGLENDDALDGQGPPGDAAPTKFLSDASSKDGQQKQLTIDVTDVEDMPANPTTPNDEHLNDPNQASAAEPTAAEASETEPTAAREADTPSRKDQPGEIGQ